MEFGLVFNEIFSSSVWEEEPHVRLVWIYLIVNRDKDGAVFGTNAALARRVNLPVEQVEDALRVLSSPDPNSSSEAEEGRRILPAGNNQWVVVNHEHYTKVENLAKRRAQTRERVRKHRESKDCNATSVTCNAPSVSVSVSESMSSTRSKDIEAKERFGVFWELYPKKVASSKCQKKFLALSKRDQGAILEALPVHRRMWDAEGRMRKYIPNPETWLNQRRWEDEISEEDLNPKPKGGFRGRGQRDPNFVGKF
jgi:hypothetical protein